MEIKVEKEFKIGNVIIEKGDKIQILEGESLPAQEVINLIKQHGLRKIEHGHLIYNVVKIKHDHGGYFDILTYIASHGESKEDSEWIKIGIEGDWDYELAYAGTIKASYGRDIKYYYLGDH